MRISMFLLSAFYLCGLSPLYAKENFKSIEEAKKTKKIETETSALPITSTKRVKGEVDVIRSDYVTIVYKREKNPSGTYKEYDMVIPLDDSVSFLHVKDFSEIKEGDTIEIEYEETAWVDKKGVGRLKRKAKKVKFIRTGVKALKSQ